MLKPIETGRICSAIVARGGLEPDLQSPASSFLGPSLPNRLFIVMLLEAILLLQCFR